MAAEHRDEDRQTTHQMFAESVAAALSGVIEQLQSSQVELSNLCFGSMFFAHSVHIVCVYANAVFYLIFLIFCCFVCCIGMQLKRR